jgi:hypothetical protein
LSAPPSRVPVSPIFLPTRWTKSRPWPGRRSERRSDPDLAPRYGRATIGRELPSANAESPAPPGTPPLISAGQVLRPQTSAPPGADRTGAGRDPGCRRSVRTSSTERPGGPVAPSSPLRVRPGLSLDLEARNVWQRHSGSSPEPIERPERERIRMEPDPDGAPARPLREPQVVAYLVVRGPVVGRLELDVARMAVWLRAPGRTRRRPPAAGAARSAPAFAPEVPQELAREEVLQGGFPVGRVEVVRGVDLISLLSW